MHKGNYNIIISFLFVDKLFIQSKDYYYFLISLEILAHLSGRFLASHLRVKYISKQE